MSPGQRSTVQTARYQALRYSNQRIEVTAHHGRRLMSICIPAAHGEEATSKASLCVVHRVEPTVALITLSHSAPGLDRDSNKRRSRVDMSRE